MEAFYRIFLLMFSSLHAPAEHASGSTRHDFPYCRSISCRSPDLTDHPPPPSSCHMMSLHVNACLAVPCALPLTAPPWLDAGVHEGRGDLRHPEYHALREETQEKPGHGGCAGPERPGPAEYFQERRREVALPRHLQGTIPLGLLVGY